MDKFILFGGEAPGPAFKLSMITEKMTMANVQRDQIIQDPIDSEIG